VTRTDGYQGILNAIAADVRSKHRKRLSRQREMKTMSQALRHLAERKKYFEEQINSYNSYVESAMQTMQKGKGYVRLSRYGNSSVNPNSLSLENDDLSCHSRSNSSICETYSALERPLSLDRIDIAPTTYMSEASFFPSTSFHPGNLIESTSFFPPIPSVSSRWKPQTRWWEASSQQQIFEWRTYYKPNSKIGRPSRFLTAWPSSTLICYCIKSTKSEA
jgi:hypothetical protein